MRSLVGLALIALVAGCGKEMGRVAFTGEGSGTSTVTLKAGEVAFWTDIDVDYTGNASLAYTVDLEQGGAKVASATCDPLAQLHTKTSWVETNIGDQHTRRGNGKMACTATLASGGATVVNAKLAFATKPTKVTLKKADLVIRQ
jgi:hypothetical protein